MRRKVFLYISGRQVDLDDQSFILFNYTFEDLSNPTIVKNSFSQQISIKGTANNNAIFGDAFRLDRVVGNNGDVVGSDFNPSIKTPFTIYNEMNEILESGYVKLDSITRKGISVEYKVTLYGGLGSFLYALSYDEQGNKRTLADLDFLGTGNADSELDFTITKENVQEAWDVLYNGTTGSKWSIINFAPAYNGIPDSNFDPGKALVDPASVGLQESITEGEGTEAVEYTTKSGYALVSLAEEQDEWAVKDLRSYLQRPVLSMKAFWDAIANSNNNGGYTVDKSVVDDITRFMYPGLWMTLPMLPSLGTSKKTTGDLSLELTSTTTTSERVARVDVVGSVPFGTKVTASLNLNLSTVMPSSASSLSVLKCNASYNFGTNSRGEMLIMFAQAIAYGSDDTIVGGSKVKSFYTWQNRDGIGSPTMAERCGYVPLWQNGDETYENSNYGYNWNNTGSNYFAFPKELNFTVEARDVAYYIIRVTFYTVITYTSTTGIGQSTSRITYVSDATALPTLYESYDSLYTGGSIVMVWGSTASTIFYTSAESLRSGAVITTSMLLSTSHTPAEYLLSFCKIFGLYIKYDPASKSVTFVSRNELFQDETIDLTKRIDTGKGITITPFVFNSKWYDLQLESVGGAFSDEYADVQGIDYGIQRVNTGYDFNFDVNNIMDSVIFKNAVTILARSKYFNIIFKSSGTEQVFQPSPFLDKGNKYTLWSTDGETLETDISCPPTTASVTYYNENGHNGYDIEEARKVEFRDSENKPVTGDDVLLILEGWNTYSYFKLTDDVPAMDLLNDGVPCWLLGAGTEAGVKIPIFSRYTFGGGWDIDKSLDFGVPRELGIPAVRYDAASTIYAHCWKKYLADRYNVNTKVMTCKVNFQGMQVNSELLRKFYWYDNSLWVLNSIKNYSLTTYDPVECEFVQVQDKDNYLNGQD